MYQVTYIGKVKLESKILTEESFKELARNLKREPFEILRGLEPCFVAKEIKGKETKAYASCIDN